MRSDRHAWPDGLSSSLHAALAAMLVATVYAASHPYWGLAHDARLYMAQALQRSGIADLSADPFFAFGSQDRFTLYSPLLGALIRIVGPSWAALIATVAGGAAMLAATFYFVRRLAGANAALAAAVIVAALPGRYSALGVPLVEPYATPRAWACALVLAGVALTLQKRRAYAVAVFAVAMSLHPLMALPGIAWAMLVGGRIRHLLGLGVGAVLAAVALAAAGVYPFDQLLVRVDDEWRRLLEDRSPYLYLLHWEDRDWSGQSGLAAMAVLASLLIAVRMEDPVRRVFLAGGLVALAGALATLVGGDWLQSALVVQLQPWRALWIASFLTLAGTAILMVRVAAHRGVEDAVLLMGVSAGLLLESRVSPVPVVVVGLLLLALARWPGAATSRWSLVAAGALFLEALVWCLLDRSNLAAAREIELDTGAVWPLALRDPFLWMALGLLVAWVGARSRVRMLRMVLSVLITVTFSFVVWDWGYVVRNDSAGVARLGNASELRAALPKAGSVYWDGRALVPWIELGYPSYVSEAQTAGIVFFRATAIETMRRTALVASAAGIPPNDRAQLLRQVPPKINLSGAQVLCRDPALSAVYLDAAHVESVGLPVINRRGHRQGTLALCDRLRHD